jgi:hypothetical protein
MADKPKIEPLKWLDDNQERFKRSKKQETRLAEELGGRRTIRSGAAAWSKYDQDKIAHKTTLTDGRDITTSEFYFEHKRTEKKSMSLKKEWLDSIKQASRRGAKDPGVIITFESLRPSESDEDWVMVPMSVFKRLTRTDCE